LLRKKKFLIGIGIIIVLAVLCAIFLLKDPASDPLKGTSWSRTTEVDSECINFNDNGHFSYYYGVGSPVDDYDLYDEYTYDDDTKTITLESIDSGGDKTIKIDRIDDDKLVLIFGDEKRTFSKEND